MTTDSMPRWCSRWARTRPAGPAPTMPTRVRSGIRGRRTPAASDRALLLERLLRHLEGCVRRRHAAVDRAVQQDLRDLVRGEPVAERRADVQRQLVEVVARHERCERHRAARSPVEAGAGPDLAPRI